jgi:hypothetical protein
LRIPDQHHQDTAQVIAERTVIVIGTGFERVNRHTAIDDLVETAAH